MAIQTHKNTAAAFAVAAVVGGASAFDITQDSQLTVEQDQANFFELQQPLTLDIWAGSADVGDFHAVFTILPGGVDTTASPETGTFSGIMSSSVITFFDGSRLEEYNSSFIRVHNTSTSSYFGVTLPTDGEFDVVSGSPSFTSMNDFSFSFSNSNNRVFENDNYFSALDHLNDLNGSGSYRVDDMSYALNIYSVTVTPTPASAALLGMGGLVASRRKRAPALVMS